MGHPVAVQEVDRVAKIIGHGLDLTNGEGVELIGSTITAICAFLLKCLARVFTSF